MDALDDLQMWSLIVGAFMPNAVAVIQQPKWHAGARAVVTVLLCAIAGGVTAALQGALTGRTFFSAFLFITVTAMTTYEAFWKKTGVAPAIEKATAPSTT